jgi:hypothetical protein
MAKVLPIKYTGLQSPKQSRQVAGLQLHFVFAFALFQQIPTKSNHSTMTSALARWLLVGRRLLFLFVVAGILFATKNAPSANAYVDSFIDHPLHPHHP